ncbi:DUF4124 domain-containing protein [Acidithiobacillus marinus]|uniref:DUF4124 domain-containing protein n=1 Tax=Acidithiobacillus marinus TaxID=187490 RepID=UPI0015573936|nr:DUF4124 domain-containing protein [Acidithiobacillus marinus]
MKPASRRWAAAVLAAAVMVSASTFVLPAQAERIYRWVSPDGTVSFGDQPPANAKKLQSLPSAPPAPPSVHPSAPPHKTPSSPPAAAEKALTAIERLNLLTALNNYQNSLRPAPEPRQHDVYIPAYIGPRPFPPYGHRPPPSWRHPPPRPGRPPVTRPPTVLLPPPAPASMYSSPVLLP